MHYKRFFIAIDKYIDYTNKNAYRAKFRLVGGYLI